jgi:cytochrome P450
MRRHGGTNDSPDLIGSFAYPLTASVIAEMLGVPEQDRDRFREWSEQITTLVFGALENPDRYSRAARGMTELGGYISGLVKRYEQAPGDNLVSGLIRARDSGDALSHEEVLATGVLLLFAGHETTTNLIGNGVLALLRHPDQLEELRSGRLDVGQAVEELLRYDGPAKTVVRVMAEDVELRGRRLAAGSRVFLCPSAANRDPAVFSRPDELDLTRRDNPHLGFGFGTHYCLGAPLARLEGGIAITRVLQRLERLRLAGGLLSWQPVLLSRGLKALPVRFGS